MSFTVQKYVRRVRLDFAHKFGRHSNIQIAIARVAQMKPGDYCRAEPGSVHTGISTRGGCQFITIASERNELLD